MLAGVGGRMNCSEVNVAAKRISASKFGREFEGEERIMRQASATILALMVLTGASLHLRAAEPDKQTQPVEPKEFAGKWVRTTNIEEVLGYGSELPDEEIELKIDDALGERWDPEQKTAVEKDVSRQGHQLVASGQIATSRLNGILWEAIMTHHKGSTYVTAALPQVGGVPFRITLIRGKTSERDLLFIELQHGKEREARIAQVYKRKAPGEKATPE